MGEVGWRGAFKVRKVHGVWCIVVPRAEEKPGFTSDNEFFHWDFVQQGALWITLERAPSVVFKKMSAARVFQQVTNLPK